jgi:hypothetical protein
MANQDLIQALKSTIASVRDQLSSLGRKRMQAETGMFFDEIRKSFSPPEVIDDMHFEMLPNVFVKNFNAHLHELHRRLQVLETRFAASEGINLNLQHELIMHISTAFDNVHMDIVTANSLGAGHFRQMENMIGSIKQEFEHTKKRGEEADHILRNMATAAGEVVIGKYVTIFADAESRFAQEAKNWFWRIATSIAVILLAAISYVFWIHLPPNASAGEIVQFSVTKVLVFAVLFLVLNLFLKNYRASKHNAITNEHRKNALAAFEAFVKSANDNDPVIKNAILLEVTKTIFAPQATGYLTTDNDGDNSSRVIEIIKNVTTSK